MCGEITHLSKLWVKVLCEEHSHGFGYGWLRLVTWGVHDVPHRRLYAKAERGGAHREVCRYGGARTAMAMAHERGAHELLKRCRVGHVSRHVWAGGYGAAGSIRY